MGLLPRPQTIDVKKPSVRTKLRYHELRDIGNNGPYNARVLVYKLNSVYDPSPEVFTTTGTTSVGNHQPEGYDWLASHYRQYRVHSVFYTIKFYTSAHKGFRYFVCAQRVMIPPLRAPLRWTPSLRVWAALTRRVGE